MEPSDYHPIRIPLNLEIPFFLYPIFPISASLAESACQSPVAAPSAPSPIGLAPSTLPQRPDLSGQVAQLGSCGGHPVAIMISFCQSGSSLASVGG